VITPIGGIITSLTNALTMVDEAAPITIPTAISTTLPRNANSLNSLSIVRTPPKLRESPISSLACFVALHFETSFQTGP
jgi:hypothetical protein